ncbi:MAG: glycosyltransferase family 39 protein [Cyanobacteriota bacterium]|nr:glycosyltransferase family 39 protein [Cyanobacteriota bacterium]
MPAAALPRTLLLAGLLLPLLLSATPHSFLAYDAGYYALQARWIEQGAPWLAPLWFGEPLFDRSIGVQWLMALSLRLFGGAPWAADLPALLAALLSLVCTQGLVRQLLPERSTTGPLALLVLALTPLWLNYAHLATQDMPLLAVELVGISALVACQPQGQRRWALLAGAAPGLAFLLKGFMVALPLLAITPYLLIERRWLLRRGVFWLGLLLGWLPVALWLGLSIQAFGLPVVSGLWQKLLVLSESPVFAGGPLYYLWNIPANTAPWCLAAAAGWWLLWRSRLQRGSRLVLLLYPLLLLLLLSGFRTKMPYYALQLTPWIAIAAAVGLEHWSRAISNRWRRLDALPGAVGAVLLAAALVLLWPGSPLASTLAAVPELPALALLAAAAAGLGTCWLVVPWQPTPQRRLAAVLLGGWLALALLSQAGLFSDRSPALRQALQQPAARAALQQPGIQAAFNGPLSDADHALLILLALATQPSPDQVLQPAAVAPGQWVWIRRQEFGEPARWRLALQGPALGSWVLAERLAGPSGPEP